MIEFIYGYTGVGIEMKEKRGIYQTIKFKKETTEQLFKFSTPFHPTAIVKWIHVEVVKILIAFSLSKSISFTLSPTHTL